MAEEVPGQSGAAPLLRRLGPGDWEVLRDLRLRALSDAPEAFASTLAREQAFDATMWSSRLSGPGSVTVAAEVPGGSRDRAVGLAGGFTPPGAAGPELVSVWVEPAWRGTGLAAGLITAVADWAVAAGAASLRLWVTSANRAARRRYETLGFVATGEVAPLPSDPTRTEEAMVLMLA